LIQPVQHSKGSLVTFILFTLAPLLTCTGGNDYNRRVEYIIPQKEVATGKCIRYIEVSANGMFGAGPQDDVRVSANFAPIR